MKKIAGIKKSFSSLPRISAQTAINVFIKRVENKWIINANDILIPLQIKTRLIALWF